MVVIDKFSRMPVVGQVTTTAAEYVLPKLDELISFLGKPEELKTDNGLPFNGIKFQEFAEFYGFKHRKITPEHPLANCLAEMFMFKVGQVIRNALFEAKDWLQELNSFLRSYRSTPRTVTGVATSILLFGADRTNRLPSIIQGTRTFDEFTAIAMENDRNAKTKSKTYTEKKQKAKTHNFNVAESVIVRQKRLNKSMPAFSNLKHVITNIEGSMISVKADDGRELTRDASRFKRFIQPKPIEEKTSGELDFNTTTPTVLIQQPPITRQEQDQATEQLRRSTRTRNQTNFYRP